MKKVIIGLTGEKGSGKTTVANMLHKMGFYKVSITNKVKEFAQHLFPDKDLDLETEIIDQVRRRGTTVHKEYWLNLILISVPNNKDFIVFDDIEMNEDFNNKIKLYQVYRPGTSKIMIENVEVIMNDGDKKSLNKSIEHIFGSIKNPKT